jgi:hypothetical protein
MHNVSAVVSQQQTRRRRNLQLFFQQKKNKFIKMNSSVFFSFVRALMYFPPTRPVLLKCCFIYRKFLLTAPFGPMTFPTNVGRGNDPSVPGRRGGTLAFIFRAHKFNLKQQTNERQVV